MSTPEEIRQLVEESRQRGDFDDDWDAADIVIEENLPDVLDGQ